LAHGDGTREHGRNLRLRPTEAFYIGGRYVDRHRYTGATLGAHAELAIGTTCQRHDRLGPTLPGYPDAAAGKRKGYRTRDHTSGCERNRQRILHHPSFRECDTGEGAADER